MSGGKSDGKKVFDKRSGRRYNKICVRNGGYIGRVIKPSDMEKYSRGRRGAPAKGIGRVTGARVQIPLSPLLYL